MIETKDAYIEVRRERGQVIIIIDQKEGEEAGSVLSRDDIVDLISELQEML